MNATTNRRRRGAAALLEGPVPPGAIEWTVYVRTDKRLHDGAASHPFEYRGVRLHYQGRVSWSTIHHEYTVHHGRGRRGSRELERAMTAAPEATLKGLARRLDLDPSDLHARIWGIRQPRCPDGLCVRCWNQGVRASARTYSVHREPDGFSLVARDFLVDFCVEHAEQVGAVLL